MAPATALDRVGDADTYQSGGSAAALLNAPKRGAGYRAVGFTSVALTILAAAVLLLIGFSRSRAA